MNKSFINAEKPLVTAMIKYTSTPETALAEIAKAHAAGAEAFGIQFESIPRQYHTKDTFARIIDAMGDKPSYVTNYKLSRNADLSYEEITDELLMMCDCGATLIDITADTFCRTEGELTFDEEAVKKQIEFMAKVKDKGCEALMSSHINKVTPAERVLEYAYEHKRRGADVSKIVVHANTPEEQMEAIRITSMLKEKLDIKYLYLAGGDCCFLQRRLGMLLGNCMSLCMYDSISVTDTLTVQPLITEQLMYRDQIGLVENTIKIIKGE